MNASCRKSLIVVVALSFSSFLVQEAAVAHPQVSCVKRLSTYLLQLHRYKFEDSRFYKSLEMAEYVNRHASCRSSKAVSRLMPLLADRNDGVRKAAAMALGYLGPIAKDAVPSLRLALKDSDAALDEAPGTTLPSSPSGDEIRLALKKITGHDEPPYKERTK